MQQYYLEVSPFSMKVGSKADWGKISNNTKNIQESYIPNKAQAEEEEDQEYKDRVKQETEDYEKISMITQDEIYAAFEIQIDTNSTLPMDKQSLANLAIRLAEMQITPNSGIDREALFSLLDFPNKQEILDRIDERQMQMMKMQMLAKGAPPGGGAASQKKPAEPAAPPLPMEQGVQ